MKVNAPLSDPWFEARFYGYITASGYRHAHEDQRPLAFAEAQGLQLWCPCGYGDPRYPLDGGRPHAIIVPFRNPPSGVPVPADHGPVGFDGRTRPRWEVVRGAGLHDLTLDPSIDSGCWHGHVTDGRITTV